MSLLLLFQSGGTVVPDDPRPGGGMGVDVGRELRRRRLEDDDKLLLSIIKLFLKKAG